MDRTKLNNVLAELAQVLSNKKGYGEVISDEYINQLVDKLVDENKKFLAFDLTNDDINYLKFTLGGMFNIAVGEESIFLRNPEIARWFDNKKSKLDWDYWNAYRTMLIKQCRPEDVINENEKVIDNILDFSGDPTIAGSWARKGLVMGNVQSGKTQNYLGLINKAIDSGYKIIILLGGHLNELRKQTQERVDEGVVGRVSKHIINNTGGAPQLLGVGINRDQNLNVHTLTTTEGDFTKSFANRLGVDLKGLSQPAIFTVKKHAGVLGRLHDWIKEHHLLDPELNKTLDLPLLLIDDEADYASINTKANKDEITKTNENIRKILSLFSRNTYVGYTATPFANIFIDPDTFDDKDDLFPSDFMVKIPASEAYQGQDYYFGHTANLKALDADSTSPLVSISDNGPIYGLKMDSVIDEIPESLKESIRLFLLVIAIRNCRGDNRSHNTMLVNVTHLSIPQNTLQHHIELYRKGLYDALSTYGSQGVEYVRKNELLYSFETTFYKRQDVDESYEDVFDKLFDAVGKVKVWALNQSGKKSERKELDYSIHKENGLNVIAIGGHRLSRGLTLEGLSVSYFGRNSKAYDTLMQMCRWYGYRPRYEDLCRVYLPDESIEWYSFITETIQELYEELDLMARMEKRPSEFGMKVREHPGAMIITAKNKMGSFTSDVRSQQLWGQVQRRFKYDVEPDQNLHNIEYCSKFIGALIKTKKPNNKSTITKSEPLIFSEVEYGELIEFIKNIDLLEDDVGNKALINHLNLMKVQGLPKVKVALFNQGKTGRIKLEKDGEGLSKEEKDFMNRKFCFCGEELTLLKRTVKSDGKHYKVKSSHMGNSDDEKIFLTPAAIGKVKEVPKANNKKHTSFDYICSEQRDFPALIIYMFAIALKQERKASVPTNKKVATLGHGCSPTLGYTISFPRPENMKDLSASELKELLKKSRHSYSCNAVSSKIDETDMDEEDE